MTTSDALKPCPVCGNAPKWRGSATDYRAGIFRLQCLGETHLFQSYGSTEAKAIEHWNNREAAEASAKLEGAKAMQARRKYPVLGTQGQAKVDWQFVEDHAKQAYENHRQTVERLAERGGLSWCELCAVVQDRKWSKMETADAIEQVRAAEARYLAALDPAQIAAKAMRQTISDTVARAIDEAIRAAKDAAP